MATNSLSATGLTVMQQQDIVTALTNGFDGAPGFTTIYGADINLGPNTPDGQMLNIFATVGADNLELLMSVYNQWTLASAYGVQLDNAGSLLGIQRQAGTYTLAQVQVTVSQALTLYGQDQSAQTIFTVADGAGNQYQLQTTYAFGGSGTTTLTFVAVNLGQVLTSPNTITTIITPITGVSSVNNSTTANDVIGANEEQDSAYRVRMAQSFQMAATGPADALRAQLLNLPGMIDAFVAENDTGSIVDGVAANGIWVIVNASGSVQASAIAQAIYSKKSAGCAQTQGAQSYNIARPAGNAFTAYWDNAVGEALYIQFTIAPINGVDTFNAATLAASLAAALTYKLGQSANVGQIITAMIAIAPNGYLLNVQVSTDGATWTQQVTPATYQKYFTVAAANITISVS